MENALHHRLQCAQLRISVPHQRKLLTEDACDRSHLRWYGHWRDGGENHFARRQHKHQIDYAVSGDTVARFVALHGDKFFFLFTLINFLFHFHPIIFLFPFNLIKILVSFHFDQFLVSFSVLGHIRSAGDSIYEKELGRESHPRIQFEVQFPENCYDPRAAVDRRLSLRSVFVRHHLDATWLFHYEGKGATSAQGIEWSVISGFSLLVSFSNLFFYV